MLEYTLGLWASGGGKLVVLEGHRLTILDKDLATMENLAILYASCRTYPSRSKHCRTRNQTLARST